MKINLNDYRVVELRDSYDDDNILGMILLNNKHSIQDFQNAVNQAKEKRREEIDEYGDDWTYISEELGDYDYIEIGVDDYITY